MTASITFWLLAAIALAGAGTVVFSRDALRLVLGLGAFLLAVAGLYLYFGMGLLAAAQVFVYVGGVLVLVLFSLLLLARDSGGRLLAATRMDASAAAVGVGLALVLGIALRDFVPPASAAPSADVASVLLGRMLPAFELLGGLLLAALVAALLIVGGGEGE